MPTVVYLSLLVLYGCFSIYTLLGYGKFQYVVSSLVICLFFATLFLSIVYIFAKKIKRYDIVDAAWGPTFIVVCFASYFLTSSKLPTTNLSLIVLFIVSVWGLRLAWHIGKRKIGTRSEDPRYVALRKNWKGSIDINVYFRIYIVQAVLATLICIPVIHINLFDGKEFTIFTWVGLAIWLFGFVFEVVADRQLKNFLENTKKTGEIMQSGLWKYSRHPNYFGEIVQWWGIGIVAAGVVPWWVGLIGPITITYLILFVSGIPPTEKRFESRTGWGKYKAKTSVLVPLLPKKV